MELISIVMPVFNAEKYLKECIDSILKQSYRNLELVVVDDGSTDKSREILKYYAEMDQRVRPYYNTNHGVSYTRNFGIRHCKSNYIAFVDADDIISKDYLEILFSNMIEYDADMSAVNIVGTSKYQECFFFSGNLSVFTGKEIFKGLFDTYHGFLCNKMYKKSIIIENDILLNSEIGVCEDLLFNAEYLEYCNKVVYDSGVKYFYRQISDSAINRLDNLKWFDFLKVYPQILEIIDTYREIKNQVEGIYTLFLCEAMYRVKFLKIPNKDLENKIIEEKKRMKNRWKYFSKKQKTKIILFELFPSIVMKYKRRKL